MKMTCRFTIDLLRCLADLNGRHTASYRLRETKDGQKDRARVWDEIDGPQEGHDSNMHVIISLHITGVFINRGEHVERDCGEQDQGVGNCECLKKEGCG